MPSKAPVPAADQSGCRHRTCGKPVARAHGISHVTNRRGRRFKPLFFVYNTLPSEPLVKITWEISNCAKSCRTRSSPVAAIASI